MCFRKSSSYHEGHSVTDSPRPSLQRSETGGTADGARSRADSRVQEIAELAKRIDGAARVLTHVVHGKPEATLLGVAAKHVRHLHLHSSGVEPG
jgi:hypothetical protein